MAERLPGAVVGPTPEGSPAWYSGRHPFARLRWDDEGRQLLQVWTGEMDTADALADRRDTFVHLVTFRFRVTMWALLERLDRTELAELLIDSYDIRGGRRRRGDVDTADLLG
jgi:hypothetical protein